MLHRLYGGTAILEQHKQDSSVMQKPLAMQQVNRRATKFKSTSLVRFHTLLKGGRVVMDHHSLAKECKRRIQDNQAVPQQIIHHEGRMKFNYGCNRSGRVDDHHTNVGGYRPQHASIHEYRLHQVGRCVNGLVPTRLEKAQEHEVIVSRCVEINVVGLEHTGVHQEESSRSRHDSIH